MTMNPLPPQAYTKDTMLRAYQWLMGQNSSIKEMATTPDILVSLFLKATRDGDHALDRPSIQNFKNELKSLAGMMGELDRKSSASSPSPIRTNSQTPSRPAQIQETTAAQTQPSAPPSAPPATSHSSAQSQIGSSLPDGFQQLIDLLDEETLQMIREVKSDFNLSHEAEALRLLVKVGYVRTKKVLG